MTYAELEVVIDGHIERRKDRNKELLYLAWHTGLFSRVDYKLPKFEDVIKVDNKPKLKQTDEQMMAMARLLNAAFGGVEVTV